MKIRLGSFILAGAALLAIFPMYAQSFSEIELTEELKFFSDDLKKLQMENEAIDNISDMEKLEWELKLFDFDFATFLQMDEQKLGTSKNLIARLLELKAAREELSTSVEKKRESIEQIENFTKAEAFISAQDTTYITMYKKAGIYSMSSKTEKFLTKLKAREAILTAKVKQSYSTASAAAESVPELKERLDNLDEEYAELMILSEKIQAAKYEPLIQRIKDYLMSFAAVSVVLMFISMMHMRLSTAKQVRDNMRKREEALKKNDDNIPTI